MRNRVRTLFGCACAVAASTAVGLSSASAAGAAPLTEAQAQQLGTQAYQYGIPLMEFMRVTREQTSVTVPDNKADAPVNQLGNARQLANATNQVIVQPNNDTLFTMGHVDVSSGALVLHVPAVPNHRYYSFEFIDPWTNVFAYVGTRTTGDGAGNYVITGPNFTGKLPHGLKRIRSPYDLAWLVGRTLVYGPTDLGEVHKIQNGYRLIPLADYERSGLSWKPPRPKHVVKHAHKYTEPSGLQFFDQLDAAMAKIRPPHRDAPLLKQLRQVGIAPGKLPSKEHLSAAVKAGLTTAVAGGPAYVNNLRTTIATASVIKTDGWFVPPADTGDYGTDYQFRAVVALFGIAANRPAEAMYIIAVTDSKLAKLNGADNYMLHFTAGKLPPAKYFWSLTMYNSAFFLVANPLNRYEIGNRTPGLVYNKDGSLDIYVGNSAPAGHESNWLPSPQSGLFEMTLRLYGPLPTALNRTYTYPPIINTG